jgi:hypothetical protein
VAHWFPGLGAGRHGRINVVLNSTTLALTSAAVLG